MLSPAFVIIIDKARWFVLFLFLFVLFGLVNWLVGFFFHLTALSRVRSLLTRGAANATAVCLILSRLDYSSSLIV